MTPVSSEVDALIAAGNAALEAGAWLAARDSFQASLELEETPEALLGLGTALAWTADLPGAIRYLEQAYAGPRRRSCPAFTSTVRYPRPSASVLDRTLVTSTSVQQSLKRPVCAPAFQALSIGPPPDQVSGSRMSTGRRG